MTQRAFHFSTNDVAGASNRRPEFAIDVGGTFTDVVWRDKTGNAHILKIPSDGTVPVRVSISGKRAHLETDTGDWPDDFFTGFQLLLPDGEALGITGYHAAGGWLDLDAASAYAGAARVQAPFEAPILAIRMALRLPISQAIPQVGVRLGSTLATNALLERRFPEPVLVVTRGMRDVLKIGYQNRPGLFDLAIPQPEPLTERVVQAEERLTADGHVLIPLNHQALATALEPHRAAGISSVAICFLHAHRNPDHELAAAEIAKDSGFAHVYLSHTIPAADRFVSRTETTTLDSALAPVIAAYVARLRHAAPEADFLFMTSTGALVTPDRFSGREAVLSGPAGGATALADLARYFPGSALIGIDMGGTSTDVCRFDGGFERRNEMELPAPGGRRFLRVTAPALRIDTVAAGGGSVCGFDGFLTSVGPASCGANPGPACYGRGGPLAVTDLNAVLGKLPIFPFTLDLNAAQVRLQQMADAMASPDSPQELAEGLLRIANATMAAAIRAITVGRGIDPRDDTLVAFGGAAPQHACALADELGITRVVVPAFGGVFSAFGIAVAQEEAVCERWVDAEVNADWFVNMLPDVENRLRSDAAGILRGRDFESTLTLEMRYTGQETRIAVESLDGEWIAAFENAHRARFGFLHARRIRVVLVRLCASVPNPLATPTLPTATHAIAHPSPVYFGSNIIQTPVMDRGALGTTPQHGPLIVLDPACTIVVDPAWRAEQDSRGNIVLTRDSPGKYEIADVALDAVSLELFHQRFAAIASQMGEMLRLSAVSTNVRERLDYSCAVFDPNGRLVVNAPHIPVHLGAMEDAVRSLLSSQATKLRQDRVWITNDPACGGSHLPDVTVVEPIFLNDNTAPAFFVSCRAHHAEIGGRTPGSMPPDARLLEEEGVLIPWLELSPDATDLDAKIHAVFSSGPYPSRNPAENLADLHAQIAACRFGAGLLAALAADHGPAGLIDAMNALRRVAREKTRQVLQTQIDESSRFSDMLDDGSLITVEIRRSNKGPTIIDFTGSAAVHPGNFNAAASITRSAVLYALRCLVGEELPLNAGMLEAVQLIIPCPSMLDPSGTQPAPATAAGNVETSQRIVDVLLGALGIAAASQGTMNNLLFGSDDPARPFGFYETLAGGSGAGPGFHGAPAVHTHMTNSRLTDPEVLETRYPVRLREWSIREASGGTGEWHGGDGMVRELECLAPLIITLITSRRSTAPFGCHGGDSGKSGNNQLLRADANHWERLPGACTIHASAGDRLRIETPGGGGWGSKAAPSSTGPDFRQPKLATRDLNDANDLKHS